MQLQATRKAAGGVEVSKRLASQILSESELAQRSGGAPGMLPGVLVPARLSEIGRRPGATTPRCLISGGFTILSIGTGLLAAAANKLDI